MPRPTWRLGPHGSIFVKLVAVMLTMALSLLLMVFGFFRFVVDPSTSASLDRMLQAYASAVAQTSPDLDTARRLASQLQLRIRYEGARGRWATDERLPAIEEARSGKAARWGRPTWGFSQHVVQAPDGGSYLFSWEFGPRLKEAHDRLLWLLLVLVVGVVVIAHAVLNRALQPLRSLYGGVVRLSEGDLDVVLPKKTRDEFGALTDGFNEMARRVKEMVRARDQLLLDVSHELRSPLTRMKVALALLPDGEKKAGMTRDVAQMEVMIGELLELERLRDGRGIRRERQDLLPLLREAVAVFEGQLPGVHLQSALTEIPLEIDAERVRTVLRNLLENAVKYSLPDSAPVSVTVSREGDGVVVRVSDDGPGIPEPDLSSLFEPFFRVDRSRSRKTGGYGLGLSICKRIMDAHGGSIAVTNGARRGATFTVTFRA